MSTELIEKAKERFQGTFGGPAEVLSFAPGRVNLIGEHTDYNEGYVFPMAVDKGVAIVGRKRKDDKVVLRSVDLEQTAEFELSSITRDPRTKWAHYFKGVVAVLLRRGMKLGGCEVVITGDLPQGAGLSSSAAFEVASAVFLQKAFSSELSDLDLVRSAQAAENEFVGLQCGIMDPFASFLGVRDHALFIDCRDLNYQAVPMLTGTKVIVFNTGVKRELASSAYNERRMQCLEGVWKFQKVRKSIHSLRDVSLCDFEKHQRLLDPVILKRCRHVISEDQRVLDAVEALRNGNKDRVRALFRESHESLRDDYEVSCPELDKLVELAQVDKHQGGSRMTGGGFGGCTIHLMPDNKEAIEAFVAFVSEGYQKKFGRIPEHYVFTPAAGAKNADID